jgi:cytochrome c oxidase assembly protein subunit 15
MITIGMLFVFLRLEPRNWVRGMGLAALALVIFQGALGGMRVLFDERTLAMLHGMTGPLFFGLTVALVIITSNRWWMGALAGSHATTRSAGQIRMVSAVTAILAYLQIVLGAVLRHVPVDSQPTAFLTAVRFHLFLAGILTLHVVLLVGLILSRARHTRPLGQLATILIALVVLQLLLGVATWMEKYSTPAWASSWVAHSGTVIRDGGWLQTHIITAHVATGSAIFGTTIALALYAHRLLNSSAAVRKTSNTRLRVAL